MIWESTFLMTAFDLAIVGGAAIALYAFVRSQRAIVQFRSNSAVFAIAAGIACIGAIYFADLLAMHVLPLFMPASDVMSIMRNLRLNVSWIVTAIAVGFLIFGFWRLMRGASPFVTTLGRDEQDITDRKRMEAAIRDSESLFRTTIDNLPLGLNVKDHDGRYLLVNETMSRRYGIHKEDFIGKTNDELFPDAKTSNEAARVQELELLRTRKITRREQEKTFQDGTTHTLLIDKFPILDDTGELVSIGVTGVDITELKEAQERNESLAAAVQSLNEGFSLFDKDDRLVVCNEQVRQFNKAIAPILVPGACFEDLVRAIAENGLVPSAIGREKEWIAERMKRHRNPGEPFELARQNGEWLLIHEQRLADGSTVTLWRNITDLKRAEIVLRESEERFRSLVNHLSDAIFVADAEGRMWLVNREACRSLGYDEDELLRCHASDIAVGITSKKYKMFWDRVQGGESLVLELEHRRKDGTEFPVEVMVDRFEMKGEPLIMAAARDITKRKQIEAQLIQSAKLANLGEMAAGLVHEISQPLSIIRFAAEGSILKMEKESLSAEEQAKQFETIDAQCQRMAKIVENMRIFSRQDDAPEEIFDPIEALKSAISLVEAQFATDGVEISAKLPRQSRRAWGRMIQFEQVVLNLLTNAGDAIAEKRDTPDVGSDWTGKIDIEGTLQESTQRLVITVTDNGLGILEENLDHIFQPFFTTKEPGTGTGLGLSVSHEIITSMSGTLRAKRMDTGTRFEITLPYIGKEEATQTVERFPGRIRQRRDTDLISHNILLVDDEAEAVSAAAGHLQGQGHRVSTAANGVEAYDLFLRDTADVVVTDIRMPRMDGKELIRKLRNHSPELPIIVLTGQLGLTEDLDEEIRPHVRQVLKKPVSLRDLEDAILDAMRHD